jgi:23S rRNA pseudouridine1911/1915/1917 synthase
MLETPLSPALRPVQSIEVDPDQTGISTITIAALPGMGQRIDKFVALSLEGVSRSRIQKWIELGAVRVNEQPVASKYKLTGFEAIEVDVLPLEADTAYEPDPIELPLLAATQDYFVLNKPAGLVVHPGAGHWRNTLLNGLLFHHPEMALLPRAGIVHRLDKDTSGLMVVARTEMTRSHLIDLLSRHDVVRTYWAVVWGQTPRVGVINQPIARDQKNKVKMAVQVGGTGKHAVTHFKRISSGVLANKPVSLVEVKLETGRTHQIRVHFQHLGFALVGDTVYKAQNAPQALQFPRQALHAKALQFRNSPKAKEAPGELQTFECSLPEDFELLLTRCGMTEIVSHVK